MAMFNKKDKTDISFTSTEKNHSVLSSAVTISGEIKTKDDLRVDGNVEGNIYCEGKVVIGPNGYVLGDIESRNIELMGKVHGDIIVHDTIRLKSSSYYKGDITTVNIEIESGANFFGNCKMRDDQADKDVKQSLAYAVGE